MHYKEILKTLSKEDQEWYKTELENTDDKYEIKQLINGIYEMVEINEAGTKGPEYLALYLEIQQMEFELEIAKEKLDTIDY